MQRLKATAPADSLWTHFPQNKFVQRLLDRCRTMGIHLGRSGVDQQWLYHPAYRTIYIWEPDLEHESLSYLVVILSHELGHAVDFDQHPAHRALTRDLHWSQVPAFIEQAAFVNGFCILKELHVPISLEQYASMIDDSLAHQVIEEVEREHLCCLLSTHRPITTMDHAPACPHVS